METVQDKLLNVREVARVLDLSARMVRKLTITGRFPAPVKIGRAVRWRDSDVQAFIANGCQVGEVES